METFNLDNDVLSEIREAHPEWFAKHWNKLPKVQFAIWTGVSIPSSLADEFRGFIPQEPVKAVEREPNGAEAYYGCGRYSGD
jgi:hypothetical protein